MICGKMAPRSRHTGMRHTTPSSGATILVGDKDKTFERCPVGVDLDPRLFRNPAQKLAGDELLDLLAAARGTQG